MRLSSKQLVAVFFTLAATLPLSAQPQPVRPMPQPGPGPQPKTLGEQARPQKPQPSPLPQPLYRSEGVAEHLNLTPQQLNRLNNLTEKLQSQFQPQVDQLGQLSEQERAAKLQELLGNFNSESMKVMGSVLNDDQMNRLRQLEMQQLGLGGVLSPDVQKQLNLTQEQQRILRDAVQQEQQQIRELQAQRQTTPQAGQKAQQQRQKANQDLLGRTLNPQQLRTLGDLLGQPFNFPPNQTTGQPGVGQPGYGYPGYGQSGSDSSGRSGGKGGKGGDQEGGKGDKSTKGMGQGNVTAEQTSPTPMPEKGVEPAPRRGPFPEPLFRTDHVVRKLDITPEQSDRLTTMAIQLQNRYRPEVERIEKLDKSEQDGRREAMLDRYNVELMKGAASILTEKQMTAFRDLNTQGGTSELRAGPRPIRP